MHFLRRLLYEVLLLILPFGSIWAGVYFLGFVNPNTRTGLSIEQENRLGDFVLDGIVSKENRIQSNAVDSVIQAIEDRFLLKNDPELSNIKIVVMESSQVNAFALPGNNLVILSGLIDFCESPEEMAGVLAHELGHIKERHVLKSLTKQLGISVLTHLIFNKNTDLINELTRKIIGTGFSREFEEKADQFAVKKMVESKIQPKHLSDFLLRMQLRFSKPESEIEFLSTHPSNEDRIKSIEKQEIPKNFKEAKINCPSWAKAKSVAKSATIETDLF